MMTSDDHDKVGEGGPRGPSLDDVINKNIFVPIIRKSMFL